jgi:hypothetical protein
LHAGARKYHHGLGLAANRQRQDHLAELIGFEKQPIIIFKIGLFSGMSMSSISRSCGHGVSASLQRIFDTLSKLYKATLSFPARAKTDLLPIDPSMYILEKRQK